MAKVENIAHDILNVQDTQYNPTQRPDVLVNTEKILHRKVLANMETVLPYTKCVMQLLAVNIFHKLLSL